MPDKPEPKPVYVLGAEAAELAQQLQLYRQAQKTLEGLEDEVKLGLKLLVDPVLADLGDGPLAKTITFAIQDSNLQLQVKPGSTTTTNRKRLLELVGPTILKAVTSKSYWTRFQVVGEEESSV